MIIKNISITNFQSYYEEQAIEFSEGLNLILGNGGKGKSKLFNAFYWVLFGKIYITEIGWYATDFPSPTGKRAIKSFDFINKRKLFETEIGEVASVSVRLELEDDKGLLYNIARSVSAKRLNEDDWSLESAWEVHQSQLSIAFDSTNGTEICEGIKALTLIDQLFPEGIRNYIWFQGEALENLINFRDKATLKAAVQHISYYPYYEKLTEIVDIAKKQIEKDEMKKIKAANKTNTRTNALLVTIRNLKYSIEQKEKEKAHLDDDISQVKVALATDESKMKGLSNFVSLISRYNKCEKEIELCTEKINNLDQYQKDRLRGLWILRSTNKYISDAKRIIEEHKTEEETLPEKKYLDTPGKPQLEEILKTGQCFVCGSTVTKGSPSYEWIEKRLSEQSQLLEELQAYKDNMSFLKKFNMFVGQIQYYPDSLLQDLSKIDKEWQDSEKKIESLIFDRKKYRDRKLKIDKEITEIRRKHGVNPVKEAELAPRLNNGITVSRTKLDKLENACRECEFSIAQSKKDLKDNEKEFKRSGKKLGAVTKVAETEWKNLSEFLKDVCGRVQENAKKDLLRQIEVRANDFYEQFTKHDVGYKGRVKIGQDYYIEFDSGLGTSHTDRKKMAVINALLSLNQEALGVYYPFINDAPTSSFDPESTNKYLLGIKDIFKQSIIMTKDVELDSENYINLFREKKISRIFKLSSKIYVDENKEPESHEVSTIIEPLK